MMTTITVTFVPKKAKMVKAKIMKGKEAVKSTAALSVSSTMPPNRAAKKPSVVPMMAPKIVPAIANRNESLSE